MPNITLSHDDCTEWRANCNAAIQELESEVVRRELMLGRYKRFQTALELQETIGSLQVDSVLSLLTKLRNEQLAASALTQEDVALAERLAACGLIEPTRLGNAAIGVLSVKPQGTAVLAFLECWRSKYPWVVQR